jgi:hypothetical protein
VAGAAVTPQDLARFTHAVLVQRDNRGRIVAEWDFDGLHLESASVTGQNGALDQKLQADIATFENSISPPVQAGSAASNVSLQLAGIGNTTSKLNFATYSFSLPSAPPLDSSSGGAGSGKAQTGVLKVTLSGTLTPAQLQALEQGVPSAVLDTLVGNAGCVPSQEFGALHLDSVKVSEQGGFLRTDLQFDFASVREVSVHNVPTDPVHTKPLESSNGNAPVSQLSAELYSFAVSLLRKFGIGSPCPK